MLPPKMLGIRYLMRFVFPALDDCFTAENRWNAETSAVETIAGFSAMSALKNCFPPALRRAIEPVSLASYINYKYEVTYVDGA